MLNQKEFYNLFKTKNNKGEDKIGKVFVFCGSDENLIKKNINVIKKEYLQNQIDEFNYIRLDGIKVTEDEILNSCETMPLMSPMKVVEIYRADFLADKDSKEGEGGNSISKYLEKYIGNMPPYTVLLLYYIFKSNREKPSSILKRLEKHGAVVVKVDKLRTADMCIQVKDIFEQNGGIIEKTELTLFCNQVESNFDIIEREVHKLCSYTNGRKITKEDIINLLPSKNESDIFNLTSYVAENNIKKAIDTLNELMFRGEKATMILRMMEKQYDDLLKVKCRIDKGIKKEQIEMDLKMHQFRCQILANQCGAFSEKYLCYMIEKCLQCEKRMKSTSVDSKMELEMLIVEGAVARRSM
ncbi:DNA polymerase III, delta subunit [Hathewaya proteolytica DSM 3090]|uniref:DNA polymerase III subunit delta n=1 Tax=Hathewaya proteolytica DSM 3090 TaxID=1121331 RepID=A0A1M6JHZ8_9CLOT|nr:DNA polymerase III subunit delta [Hathewaya proteolytica]SHJ46280.1 DNA polymerase III, delta subunit [Hathewaya proteolytica DSM 3090]